MNTQFTDLITRHLEGTLTVEEKQQLAAMLKVPENQLYLASQIDERFANASLSEVGDEAVRAQIFQGVQQKLREPVQQPQATAKLVHIAWYRNKITQLFAVAAACAAIILFVWKPWRGSLKHENIQTITVAEGAAIKKVKLADGTLVWVKPNSTLTFPVAFANGAREISLKGEALFEVAKDAQHPFTVHCSNMNVQVLGTSFNIKDSKEKDTVEIAVLTGKVWVNPLSQPNMQKAVLMPNEKLRFSRQTGWVNKGIFTSGDEYTTGTAYDMKFMNTPIDSIAKKIEEKFDVTVLVNKHTSDCRVSGNFTDQPLEHMVDALCRSLEASCSINRDTVRISGLKCE